MYEINPASDMLQNINTTDGNRKMLIYFLEESVSCTESYLHSVPIEIFSEQHLYSLPFRQ